MVASRQRRFEKSDEQTLSRLESRSHKMKTGYITILQPVSHMLNRHSGPGSGPG
jgi:hypothetical protein